MSGAPVWMVDAPNDVNFPRAAAARRSGLHAGFAFPVRDRRGVIGVMEFFSGELREPDERLLATMTVLGTQIGQLVARRQADEKVRASESRLRAMLEAALDAVVTMDADGRVIGWNPAAEVIFGHRAGDVIGRDMAEVIVPPRLRERHRRGLARFIETGRGVVLDRRLELTGLRCDGSEFPVELTITRIPLPGPPTFTGYLRDITDRVRSEQELRTSRARLVEVADAERKRIQRNLHDGSQQRLTSVLLYLGQIRAAAAERTHCSTPRSTSCRRARGDPRARPRTASPGAERARARRRPRRAHPARAAAGHARGPAGPAAARSGRGRGLLRRRRSARPTCTSTLGRPTSSCGWRSTATTSTSASSTTASAALIRTATACEGSPTASRRSAGGSRSTVPPAGERGFAPRSRARRRRGALSGALREQLEPRLGPRTVGPAAPRSGGDPTGARRRLAVVSAPRHRQSR